MGRKTTTIVFISLLIGVLISSYFNIGSAFAFTPDGADYPYEDNQTTVYNENYTANPSYSANSTGAMKGTGYFDSQVSNVGQSEYGTIGTYTNMEWDATIPDYQYGTTDIQLTPQYYSKAGYTGYYTSGSTWTNRQNTGGDHYTNTAYQFTQWTGTIYNTYSSCIASGSYHADSGWAAWTVNHPTVPSRADDGIWYAPSDPYSALTAIDGEHGAVTVGGIGVSTWLQSYNDYNVQLNVPGVDGSWYITGITINLGVEQMAYAGGGQTVSMNMQLIPYSNPAYVLISNSWSASPSFQVFKGWDDLSPGGWTTGWGSGQKYKSMYFDIPDYTINYYTYGAVGGYYRFVFRCYVYAWDNWLWKLVDVTNIQTEFDVYFHLRWSSGSGTFRGSTGQVIAQTQYHDGSWSSSYSPDNTGYLQMQTSYTERSSGLSRIQTVDSAYMYGITSWYHIYHNAWCDTEWGSGISDVNLQWYDGSNWNTFSTFSWDISTPNLNSEDWYVAGVGIKFKIRAIGYVGGINGVAFSYIIDYHNISFEENLNTTSFMGTQPFEQNSGRFIDENWNAIEFNNTPYFKQLKIETTILSLSYEQVGYNNDTFLYFMNTTFSGVQWDGDQSELITFHWQTDDDYPIVSGYYQVIETVEYKPTLFNVTASDTTSNITAVYVITNNNTLNTTIGENTTYELTQSTDDHYYDYLHIPMGNYSVWYLVLDNGGNWATSPKFNLTVSKGNVSIDIKHIGHYAFASTGNRLLYNISDSLGGDWELYIDYSLHNSGTWTTPSEIINVSIDGYGIGVHPFYIYANNTLGRFGYAYGHITVYSRPVFVQTPINTSVGECSPNFNVTWSCADDNPRNFSLSLNGVVVKSGNWSNYQLIKYEVNPTILAQSQTHNFTMIFEDFHNVTVIDYYGVNIFPIAPIVSDEHGGYLYEDDSAVVSWTVVDYYAKNYTVEYYDDLLGWTKYYENNLSSSLYTQYATVEIDATDFTAGDNITFRVFVYDKNGNMDTDNLTALIIAHPPILTDQVDGFYYSDDTSAVLQWTATDNNLLSYWITINDTAGTTLATASLTAYSTQAIITLNLASLNLAEGYHLITIFVQDTYGNIVNDTVIVQNLGAQAGIEIDINGLMTWAIVIAIAVFGLYALSKSDQWERYTEKQKRNYTLITIGATAGILLVLAIFGVFPVTFTKLAELAQTFESTIGEYGVILLVVGVSIGTLVGVGLIYYYLKKRKTLS